MKWALAFHASDGARLLHSPSLVAEGLSVGYEADGFPFVIGCSKIRLGLPQYKAFGAHRTGGDLLRFSEATAVRAVQGDRESV